MSSLLATSDDVGLDRTTLRPWRSVSSTTGPQSDEQGYGLSLSRSLVGNYVRILGEESDSLENNSLGYLPPTFVCLSTTPTTVGARSQAQSMVRPLLFHTSGRYLLNLWRSMAGRAQDADDTPLGERLFFITHRTIAQTSLERFRSDGSSALRSALFDRLTRLQALAAEDDEENPLSDESLRHFGRFLDSWPDCPKPLLSLTPSGDVYATWVLGEGRKVSAHFYSSGVVRLTMMLRNPARRAAPDVLSFRTTADVAATYIQRNAQGTM